MNETATTRSRKMLVKLLRFIGPSGATMREGAADILLEGDDGRHHKTTRMVIEQALAAGLVTAVSPIASQPSVGGLGPSPPPSPPAPGRIPAATVTPPQTPTSTSFTPTLRPTPSPTAGPAANPTAKALAAADRPRLMLLPAARSFMRRAAAEAEEAFLAQHADVVGATAEVDGIRQPVRLDQSESPLAVLARLRDRSGAAFLPAAAIDAGERLAADFNRGQLQPRVTASWEPRLSSSARGARGGMADLADSAMAARLAVNRATAAMGPELSGVALDVCCFMKGLTVIERERQWPARSAKLMLRTALLALSRHYWPPRPEKPGRTRHWGTQGYRPDWS